MPLDNWERVQSGNDACRTCRAESLFEHGPPPARPPNPVRPGRLLFVAEAPPRAGGFWRDGVNDDLRKNLLTLLKKRGLPVPSNFDSQQAIAAFLDGGFFLIHALKWPLAKGTRRTRPNFNQLGSQQQRKLIDHSTTAHLQHEINLIAPAGILAMGNAAWQACRRLNTQGGLPDEDLTNLRAGEYDLTLADRSIPLNVAFLPVGQNLRDSERAKDIETDFRRFLDRHRWKPDRWRTQPPHSELTSQKTGQPKAAEESRQYVAQRSFGATAERDAESEGQARQYAVQLLTDAASGSGVAEKILQPLIHALLNERPETVWIKARKTVEALARVVCQNASLQVAGRGLADLLKEISERRLLGAKAVAYVHTIRIIGNAATHPGQAETYGDADYRVIGELVAEAILDGRRRSCW